MTAKLSSGKKRSLQHHQQISRQSDILSTDAAIAAILGRLAAMLPADALVKVRANADSRPDCWSRRSYLESALAEAERHQAIIEQAEAVTFLPGSRQCNVRWLDGSVDCGEAGPVLLAHLARLSGWTVSGNVMVAGR